MNIVVPLGRLTYLPSSSGTPLQMAAVLGRPALFWLLDRLDDNFPRSLLWSNLRDFDNFMLILVLLPPFFR